MPIFEYRCARCRNVYEILHLGRENVDDVVCPACGSCERTKLFSPVATIASGGRESRCESGPGSCCGGSCGIDADPWN